MVNLMPQYEWSYGHLTVTEGGFQPPTILSTDVG